MCGLLAQSSCGKVILNDGDITGKRYVACPARVVPAERLWGLRLWAQAWRALFIPSSLEAESVRRKERVRQQRRFLLRRGRPFQIHFFQQHGRRNDARWGWKVSGTRQPIRNEGIISDGSDLSKRPYGNGTRGRSPHKFLAAVIDINLVRQNGHADRTASIGTESFDNQAELKLALDNNHFDHDFRKKRDVVFDTTTYQRMKCSRG